MTTSSVPQGFLGLPNLDDLTKLLPPQITDAIKGTVGKILDPNDPEINAGDPQPEGERPIPVEPGTKEMSATVKALDAAIGAIDIVLKLGILIPDGPEGVIKMVRSALVTIRSWLD